MYQLTTPFLLPGLLAVILTVGCGSAPTVQSETPAAAPEPAMAETQPEHMVVSGVVTRLDSENHEMVIETSDGSEETIEVPDDTPVQSIAQGGAEVGRGASGIATGVAGGTVEGAHVTAHYSTVGATKTAEAVTVAGDTTVEESKVTVRAIDADSRTVAVTTADGAQEVYELSENALVETGQGAEKLGEGASQGVTEGAQVTAHYTVEGGKKVIHSIGGLFR